MIGLHTIYREKVSSTNDLAAGLLKSGSPPEGTVIYAGEQTRGRGQKGNEWVSEAGMNLIVSIILYPRFLEPEHQFMVSKVISVSIANLLEAFSDSISIKWPNDIYHKDDKIAGILIEFSLEGNRITNCIAGAGINIRQTAFPPGLPNPVSLGMIDKGSHDTALLLKEYCSLCDYWYGLLRAGKEEKINNEYHRRLYRLNTASSFLADNRQLRGSIRGTDRYGRLIIDLEDGTTGVYGFREIDFIP